MSAIAEASAPALTIDAVFSVLKLLARRSRPIAGVYAIFAVTMFVLKLPVILASAIVAFFDSGVLGLGLAGFSLFWGVLLLVPGAVFAIADIGMARSFRLAAFSPDEVGGIFSIIRRSLGGFFSLAVFAVPFTLVGAIAGAMCVLPGLAYFLFLGPATYLVAARETDMVSACKQSVEMVQRNIGPAAVAAVACVVVIGVGAGIAVVANLFVHVVGAIVGRMLGAGIANAGTSLVTSVLWLGTYAAMFAVALIRNAFYVAMDAHENGLRVVESA